MGSAYCLQAPLSSAQRLFSVSPPFPSCRPPAFHSQLPATNNRAHGRCSIKRLSEAWVKEAARWHQLSPSHPTPGPPVSTPASCSRMYKSLTFTWFLRSSITLFPLPILLLYPVFSCVSSGQFLPLSPELSDESSILSNRYLKQPFTLIIPTGKHTSNQHTLEISGRNTLKCIFIFPP